MGLQPVVAPNWPTFGYGDTTVLGGIGLSVWARVDVLEEILRLGGT